MISVIIPSRNRPRFLEEAIASVTAQTLRGLDIIVVNDGDESLSGNFAMGLRVIENGQRGPVAARNAGIRSAKHGLIAFLDDDDTWTDTQHLERAADRLSCGADFYFADGYLAFNDRRRENLSFCFEADTESLERDNTILISAVCYRRSLHDKLGEFDEALPFYWDWDWYLRVARSGARLYRHAFPSAAIRIHDANMSGPDTSESRQANLLAFARKHDLSNLRLKNHLSIAVDGVK
jgi:glycosyltransferase involved in cell wall biosynthesis